MAKEELKLTLQQLMSLYTGGRPVGIRDFIVQYEEFYNHYNQLMYLDLFKFEGKQKLEAEKLNFKNLIATIDLQYPQLKKSKKLRELCREYVKKVPTLYSDKISENIINHGEYQILGQKLMKEARSVLGSQKYFTVKNLKAFSGR